MEDKSDLSLEKLCILLEDESGNSPDPCDLAATETAFINFAQKMAKQPTSALNLKILHKLKRLNNQAQTRAPFTLDNLPLLSSESNWLDWEQAVASIAPPEDFENLHLHSLAEDESRELFLAWVHDSVSQEVHHDLVESLILLDGTCECHIWRDNEEEKRIVRMQVGDYLEMELGENHVIFVTSRLPAKAVLQWLKVAI